MVNYNSNINSDIDSNIDFDINSNIVFLRITRLFMIIRLMMQYIILE